MRAGLTRRDMLCASAGLLAMAQRGWSAEAAEKAKVISRRPDLYHGWPTLARRRNGQLLLVYSGGREAHVCPFGRVELMTSDDNGQTWSEPRVLCDTEIDDRDAGVLETAKGTLLVTTFTSLAYEPILAKKPDPRWLEAHNRLRAKPRKAKLGVWMLRSRDGGATWSKPYDSLVNSPHGPVQLSDGRILYPGKDLWRGGRMGVCESADDGMTWRWLAEAPIRPGDTAANYHELHAVETKGGSIVLHIRNHNRANAGETLQSESTDGGKTWSVPHSIGVWGLPSHLLRLRDDRLLMTYGHRRKLFGNQARVSENSGKTWSQPITVSDDGAGGDLGYPSTVELADGSLLTVWYEQMGGSPRAVLRQRHWKLM